MGRRNEDPCDAEYCCDDWDFLATALIDMVLQVDRHLLNENKNSPPFNK